MQAGVEKLAVLRVLYLSNNRIRDWAEVDCLAKLPGLQELVLMGNPLIPAPGTPEYRAEVCAACQNLTAGGAWVMGNCCTSPDSCR
jgi:dynein light chain 1